MPEQNNFVRMLDKRERPTFEDLISYCGDSGNILRKLNKRLEYKYRAARSICFPFGKDGWCIRYQRNNKKICEVFAENGAFDLVIRMPNILMDTIYNELSDYAKDIWDNRHLCRNINESRISFRVVNMEQYYDLEKIIREKLPFRWRIKRNV